ncbi:MAG: hypothetical protein K2Y37_14700 [Pirellulales bacterium]|nr:hypothetical protein [Pirellulales bacterium]
MSHRAELLARLTDNVTRRNLADVISDELAPILASAYRQARERGHNSRPAWLAAGALDAIAATRLALAVTIAEALPIDAAALHAALHTDCGNAVRAINEASTNMSPSP